MFSDCGAHYTGGNAAQASDRQIGPASPRLVLGCSLGVENAIRDARHLCHFFDIVDADDMRAIQDARRDSGGRAPDTLLRRSRFVLARQRRAKKTLARSAHQ